MTDLIKSVLFDHTEGLILKYREVVVVVVVVVVVGCCCCCCRCFCCRRRCFASCNQR